MKILIHPLHYGGYVNYQLYRGLVDKINLGKNQLVLKVIFYSFHDFYQ